ncbi:hypothetical protein D6D18_10463 [Aureobasidium pullulans]|nr:hypothetical protein D6D18_10463 [Aureobasidium pullulans]
MRHAAPSVAASQLTAGYKLDEGGRIPQGHHKFGFTTYLANQVPIDTFYDLGLSSYQIGIICALAIEKAVVEVLLDEEHSQLHNIDGDENIYTFGRVHLHCVVIACLPGGSAGKVSAARVAKDMLRSFPAIKLGLMVGIGGGVWTQQTDLRLGDVVVSEPNNMHGGVVQWDFDKTERDGIFLRIHFTTRQR